MVEEKRGERHRDESRHGREEKDLAGSRHRDAHRRSERSREEEGNDRKRRRRSHGKERRSESEEEKDEEEAIADEDGQEKEEELNAKGKEELGEGRERKAAGTRKGSGRQGGESGKESGGEESGGDVKQERRKSREGRRRSKDSKSRGDGSKSREKELGSGAEKKGDSASGGSGPDGGSHGQSSGEGESSASGSESESGSSSSSSSSDSEEERRRRRKKKEKRKRERREAKEKERRRREKKRKLKAEKKKEEKEAAKKAKKEKLARGPLTERWGKYGIVKETDMWNRRPEFSAWLSEVKHVNLEAMSNWEEKQMFQEYMEDYNTATFPNKKRDWGKGKGEGGGGGPRQVLVRWQAAADRGAIGPWQVAASRASAKPLLSKEASEAVKELLPPSAHDLLPRVCAWADEIKRHQGYGWTAPLHFIDTPDFLCAYNYSRDCYYHRVPNNCAAAAINNYTQQLQAFSSQRDDKWLSLLRGRGGGSSASYNLTEALMFLSHFVGDIHQPLHVGFTGDLGGNTIHVKWFGRAHNLHEVNLEAMSNWEEKQMFQEYMEDYNTATFPNKKYYSLDLYQRDQMMKAAAKGAKQAKSAKPTEMVEFNDEDIRREEIRTIRAQQKEAEVQALKRAMQSGMAEAMRNQAQLREEMQYQYRLGNFEAAAVIQKRLEPDQL
eukprot:jgi/Mesen1/1911/ME000143S00961